MMEQKEHIGYSVGDLVYDAQIYDGLNTFLSDLAFYKKWMPENKNAPVLELCCGSGRLTIPLAKEGLNITGVDNSKTMLMQAVLKSKQENLNINFIESDIRTLEIPYLYGLIFIPFNSIHHLYTNEDFFKTLKVVLKHLDDGGLFIFDCYNPDIQYISEFGKKKVKIAEYDTSDGRSVLIEQSMKYESSSQVNRIEWHYYLNGLFHSIQNLDMRMYFPQELDAYLHWHGFDIIHKFGGFEEQDFGKDSPKQILICKKRVD